MGQPLRQVEARDAAERRSASASLRARTRDAHARAERVAVLAALARDDIDVARYGAMLGALAALFAAWEHEASVFLKRDVRRAGWLYASRCAALADDLAELGAAAVAAPRDVHPLDSDAARWGMLYVVEGAALGGHVLAGSVRRAIPGSNATRYLDIADRRDGTWRDFRAVLDAALADDTAIDAAVRGADAMFLRYERALEEI